MRVNASDRSQGPPRGTDTLLCLLVGSDGSWGLCHRLGADLHPSSRDCRRPDTQLAVEGGGRAGEGRRDGAGRARPPPLPVATVEPHCVTVICEMVPVIMPVSWDWDEDATSSTGFLSSMSTA